MRYDGVTTLVSLTDDVSFHIYLERGLLMQIGCGRRRTARKGSAPVSCTTCKLTDSPLLPSLPSQHPRGHVRRQRGVRGVG